MSDRSQGETGGEAMTEMQINDKIEADLERLIEQGFKDQARRELELLMGRFGGEEVLQGIKALREWLDEELSQ
jgi:uncharacterized protein HemY